MRNGLRLPLAALICLGLAACDSDPVGEDAEQPVPADRVTVSGKVTYDFVPLVPLGTFGGLDYSRTEARPVRLATVQFIEAGVVAASTTTDANGDYSLTLDPSRSGFLRVRAETVATGTGLSFDFRVVYNTDGDAIYTLDGAAFSTGTADSVRDLHASSGWTGNDYGAERAAAPFAILDTILIGRDFVLEAAPGLDFPALVIHWSPNNVASVGEDGDPDYGTGEIGSSLFSLSEGLFLLGAEDTDTEEYDRHVILHEFAHYLEYRFSRSETFGGPHARGDLLDLRVAFSEGWATAFAGLALDDPIYRDTGGSGQAFAFAFDIEGGGSGFQRGWYAEFSVLELIYDLVDTAIDGNDILSYPFSTVWSVMTGPMKTTHALASIFPFLNGLKTANASDQAIIDQLAQGQAIASVTTDFGENETNDAGSIDVLPIYTPITVDGPAVNICSTDEFSGATTGSENKLGSRRLLRFTPPAAGNVTITMTATSIPAGENADPDFWLFLEGQRFLEQDGLNAWPKGQGPPSAACEDVAGVGWDPARCRESATFFVTPDEHVLEVYEWTNTNESDDAEYPPIGRTCFNVTVTQ
jgi:hypothetical protein